MSSPITQVLAGTQQYSGRYRQAEATTQQAFEQAEHSKAPDAQAGLILMRMLSARPRGSVRGNEAVVRQGLALDKSKQTQENAVLAAAVCGNGKLAIPMAQDLSKKYPEDTLIQDVFLPLAKAFVALAGGRPAQAALDYAKTAKPYDMLFPGSYVQGLAYLQLHDAGTSEDRL